MEYIDPYVTWSPCGQFIAVQTKEVVEIHDGLTFELISTLQPAKPTFQLVGIVAYSPDGHFLACISNTAIIIWDIQTGGVAKEIQCDGANRASLIWSLDGKMISTAFQSKTNNSVTICGYNVVSGTALPPIILLSYYRPRLWAHGTSFLVSTVVWVDRAYTINIFETMPTLTKVKSFPTQLRNCRIAGFSHTAYRIPVQINRGGNKLLILDVQTLEVLLDVEGDFRQNCFSLDGSLFAAIKSRGNIHIWKYSEGHYIPWREFPNPSSRTFYLRFSPTLLSILSFGDIPRLWHLDNPSNTSTLHSPQFTIFSHSGKFVVTTYCQKSTITIANLLTETPHQFIETGIKIVGLGLTGNVLLVKGPKRILAWLLTEDGLVNNTPNDRMAGWSDSIWSVLAPQHCSWDLVFLIEGETGVIKSDGKILHIYNTTTGEVLKPTQELVHLKEPHHLLVGMKRGQDCLYDTSAHITSPEGDEKPSQAIHKGGWIEDHDGKHLLWLPVEWRPMYQS